MSNYAILIAGVWFIGALIAYCICAVGGMADDEINRYMRGDKDDV